MLSVVIPAYNAADTLPVTLESLAEGRDSGLVGEIIVVDGGSVDATADIAARFGARFVPAEKGRGPQLAAGGYAAGSPWLLFLHADTMLTAGWAAAVRDFIDAPGAQEKAAVFQYRLNDLRPAARRLERIVRWRSRILGLPYGDQGLLIARDFYDRLGGFRPLPLMEDVDLIRRIGKNRLTELDVPAITSPARYANGYFRRSSRNVLCLSLYFLGLPPHLIARIYQ